MADPTPGAFRNLLAYQIASTADAIRRSAAMRMRRELRLSLAQVRTLGLISHLQPVRLRDVAAHAGADKAQISRVVSSLVARGLVSRQTVSGDARSANLELTPDGRDIMDRLTQVLQERDVALRSTLQPAQVDTLIESLASVRHSADALSEGEERLQQP